jgi:hypothetical protein
MAELRFLADENFNELVLNGLLRRVAPLDVVSARAAGLSGSDDEQLLEWAAEQNRIVLTHDIRTLVKYAWARVEALQAMPGIVAVPQRLLLSRAIDELELLVTVGLPEDFAQQVRFLPL